MSLAHTATAAAPNLTSACFGSLCSTLGTALVYQSAAGLSSLVKQLADSAPDRSHECLPCWLLVQLMSLSQAYAAQCRSRSRQYSMSHCCNSNNSMLWQVSGAVVPAANSAGRPATSLSHTKNPPVAPAAAHRACHHLQHVTRHHAHSSAAGRWTKERKDLVPSAVTTQARPGQRAARTAAAQMLAAWHAWTASSSKSWFWPEAQTLRPQNLMRVQCSCSSACLPRQPRPKAPPRSHPARQRQQATSRPEQTKTGDEQRLPSCTSCSPGFSTAQLQAQQQALRLTMSTAASRRCLRAPWLPLAMPVSTTGSSCRVASMTCTQYCECTAMGSAQ